jgi:1-deoxy-D-xylulose-5-phosphate synthase
MAVLTLGAIGNTMIEAIQQVEKDKPVSIAHYDMRWLKPIDEALLHQIGKQYSKIITLEGGLIEGGLGSAVLEFMADNGYHPTVLRLGVDDQFVEHGSTKQLYEMLHLDKKGLCESLLQALEL